MARRVLLVDDELDIVYLVKVGLERNGFEVDSYVDPILALHNFKRGTYQLLILDIKMPKMNGLDFLDKIKKEDDEIKVFFSQHLKSLLLIIRTYSKTLRINFSLYQNQYQFLK